MNTASASITGEVVMHGTLFDVLSERARKTPNEPAFGEWTAGTLEYVSFRTFHDEVIRASVICHGLGARKGDRVGILLSTSLAFEVAQFGLSCMGAIVVGLDPRDSELSLERAITNTEITGLVVADLSEITRLHASIRNRLKFVIEAKRALTQHWRGATRKGGSLEPTALARGGQMPSLASAHDIATIAMTSGSLGEPKGYAYRHEQVIAAAYACRARFPYVGMGSRLIAWLPLSSLFQRMIDLVGWIAGATTHFVPEPSLVIERTQEVNPTVFFGVPRFYQKLRASIVARAAPRSLLRRWLTLAALSICRMRGRAIREGRSHRALDLMTRVFLRPVIAPIRSVFGSDLKAAVTGSAPMPLELLDELEGLGIPMLEAYGLSECIVPVAMNELPERRAGTVGRPLSEHDVRLGEDGEIEVRSAGLPVFALGAPLPMTSDGYLRTGDVGTIDSAGYLRIIDRKGSMFKLSTGHKIAPAPIEESLKRLSWVDQAQVLGRGRTRPIAIVWIDSKASPGPAQARAHFARALGHLDRRQQPADYLVIPRPACHSAGEVTLTQKLRRADNERRYLPMFPGEHSREDRMVRVLG